MGIGINKDGVLAGGNIELFKEDNLTGESGNLTLDEQFGEAGGNDPAKMIVSSGLNAADYFANTKEAIAKGDAALIGDQLDAEAAALKTLSKTQEASKEAANLIYGAEYSNNQMTDKFGWTGGQLMDSKTRMQYLRDNMSADILSNEQYIDAQFSNDISKAKMALVNNRMEIAEEAAKDAYSKAISVAEYTGYYIDPVAGDLLGRYNTSIASGGELDPQLEESLIAMGFYKTINGEKVFDSDAASAMSGILTSLDREQWETGLRQAIIEMGLTDEESEYILGNTSDLIEQGEDVDDGETDPNTGGDGDPITDPNTGGDEDTSPAQMTSQEMATALGVPDNGLYSFYNSLEGASYEVDGVKYTFDGTNFVKTVSDLMKNMGTLTSTIEEFNASDAASSQIVSYINNKSFKNLLRLNLYGTELSTTISSLESTKQNFEDLVGNNFQNLLNAYNDWDSMTAVEQAGLPTQEQESYRQIEEFMAGYISLLDVINALKNNIQLDGF